VTAKTFVERLAEDRRLVILRLLERSAGYEANETVIAMALHDHGDACSFDQVRIDFAWLKDAGLLTIEETAGLQIAHLTNRGAETAMGIVTTPGVSRPRPGE